MVEHTPMYPNLNFFPKGGQNLFMRNRIDKLEFSRQTLY